MTQIVLNGLQMGQLVSSVSLDHTTILNKISVFGSMTTVKHGVKQTDNVQLVMTAMVTHGKMEKQLMENVLITMDHNKTI